MNKTAYILLTIAITTSITLNSYSAPVQPAAEKGFHGIQSGDIETLKYIEKQCPSLIKTWLPTREIHKEIPQLYKVFGTADRKSAESRAAKLCSKLLTEKNKYAQQFSMCEKKLAAKLKDSSKKLASLQKKKTLSPSAKKKMEGLEKDISQLKKVSDALFRIKPSTYTLRIATPLQRVHINAGSVAVTEFEKNAPNIVKYRMAIQDYVSDIEKLKVKGADKLTSTDKQKIKRYKQQLAATYTKLEKACNTYTKKITLEANKLKKKQDAIIVKTEKAEKMKRSTDKLDRERLTLISEISTLNYQLDVAEKVLACPKAKKLVPTLGQ